MRLALLTGGSRGLGLALCRQLTAAGFRVVEFSRGAPHAYSVRADLAAPETIPATVSKAIAALGDEVVEELWVINNAGTLAPIGPAAQKSSGELAANLNANFTSAILFIATAVAHFQALPCRKVVANISSGAAQRGYAGWSLYCAAKAGMENFIRSLALEQQGEGASFIPINIAPGVIDTEMQACIRAASVADFPDVARFIQRKQQGDLAPPEQVAAAILRILSSPSLVFGERYDVSDYRS